MSRFIVWLAVGVAAAFLVVASASFSLGAISWLGFAIGIGTLVVSSAAAYYDRTHVGFLSLDLPAVVISAWTIVASLVFSSTTVQHLVLASSLAISGLALAGLSVNEYSHVGAFQAAQVRSSEGEGEGEGEVRLAAAA